MSDSGQRSPKRARTDAKVDTGAVAVVGDAGAAQPAVAGSAAATPPPGSNLPKDPTTWTVDQVQQWFAAHNEGQWSQHADKFAGLTGEQLCEMTEEQIKTEVLGLSGSALFNDIAKLKKQATSSSSESGPAIATGMVPGSATRPPSSDGTVAASKMPPLREWEVTDWHPDFTKRYDAAIKELQDVVTMAFSSLTSDEFLYSIWKSALVTVDNETEARVLMDIQCGVVMAALIKIKDIRVRVRLEQVFAEGESRAKSATLDYVFIPPTGAQGQCCSYLEAKRPHSIQDNPKSLTNRTLLGQLAAGMDGLREDGSPKNLRFGAVYDNEKMLVSYSTKGRSTLHTKLVTPTEPDKTGWDKLRVHLAHIALLMYWSSGADPIPVSQDLAAEDVRAANDDSLASPRKTHARSGGGGGGASGGNAPPPLASFLPPAGPAGGGAVDAVRGGESDRGNSAVCVPGSPRVLSRRALAVLNFENSETIRWH